MRRALDWLVATEAFVLSLVLFWLIRELLLLAPYWDWPNHPPWWGVPLVLLMVPPMLALMLSPFALWIFMGDVLEGKR